MRYWRNRTIIEIFRDNQGKVHKALIEGTVRGMRACMDQYLSSWVSNINDFRKMKRRYEVNLDARYPAQWRELMLQRWKDRECPLLVLGLGLGFYWLARDWMGTENVCYAWYDEPLMMHEMMEFIQISLWRFPGQYWREFDIDYVMINEDMSMKTGPLLGPAQVQGVHFPPYEEACGLL